MECEFCGTKFQEAVRYGKPKITLINVINQGVVEIPEDGGLIGRSCDIAPEIFNHKWVSDPHCRITLKDNQCYIEDIGGEGAGSTNGTFLDGIKLAPRIPTKLYDGTKIRIAHLIFDGYVKYSEFSDIPVEERLIWVIECPGSGIRYEVSGANTKITECECCQDSIDKKGIGKVKPKLVRAV